MSAADAQQWAREVFLGLKRPFRVHNVYHDPSWLERFSGVHPPQINAFRGDLENGRLQVEVRKVDDIERLLSSKGYQLGRAVVRGLEPVDRRLRKIRGYGRARGWLGSTARRLGIGWGFP